MFKMKNLKWNEFLKNKNELYKTIEEIEWLINNKKINDIGKIEEKIASSENLIKGQLVSLRFGKKKKESLKEIVIGIYFPSQLLLWSLEPVKLEQILLNIFFTMLFMVLMHSINKSIFWIEMEYEELQDLPEKYRKLLHKLRTENRLNDIM